MTSRIRSVGDGLGSVPGVGKSASANTKKRGINFYHFTKCWHIETFKQNQQKFDIPIWSTETWYFNDLLWYIPINQYDLQYDLQYVVGWYFSTLIRATTNKPTNPSGKLPKSLGNTKTRHLHQNLITSPTLLEDFGAICCILQPRKDLFVHINSKRTTAKFHFGFTYINTNK
jgi:hypothetical protein